MSSQEAFLHRIRRALHKPSIPPHTRPPLLYDDASAPAPVELQQQTPHNRAALITQVQEQLTAVGGEVVCLTSAADAVAYICRLVAARQARTVVRWQSDILQALEVEAALQAEGVTVHLAAVSGHEAVDDAVRRACRDFLSQADIGLSGVDYVIAETGTMALRALPGQMRGVSLLPPVHVAVARTDQIVASMADCLVAMCAGAADVQQQLSSCVSFITGPSRTGDIELTLTIGVHGPGELHLILLDDPAAA